MIFFAWPDASQIRLSDGTKYVALSIALWVLGAVHIANEELRLLKSLFNELERRLLGSIPSSQLGRFGYYVFYYANENLRNFRERYTKRKQMNFSNRLISFDLKKNADCS